MQHNATYLRTTSTDSLPSYADHDGFRLPASFPTGSFSSALSFEAQPGDLFVAAYPKCGTTWCQNVVYLILNDGKPLGSNESLGQMFPFLEQKGSEFVHKNAKVLGGHRLIKTHLPYGKTPKHPESKYIFMARNPKDCVVSFYHHTRGFVEDYDFAQGSFDTYFRLFIDGKVDFGDYFDCLRSWLDHRDDPNVLFLTYEQMCSDSRAAILKIASFLGTECAKKLKDEDLLQRVLQFSSFDSMRQNQQRWVNGRSVAEEHTPFIRRGGSGKWDELLDREQIKRLDTRTREICSENELMFLGDLY